MSAVDASQQVEDAPVTFNVKSSGNAKYTLTLPLSTTTVELKNKLAGEEYANVPASAQRLIYSGRVLKDEDTLATHKVKEGNTMHLVKSAASNQRQNPAAQTTSSGAPQPAQPAVPQNIAAGSGGDPLLNLTGGRYAGYANLPSAGMFGPDGGMTQPDPDAILNSLEDPNTAQMMNEALQNPQVVDMMIRSSPQLQAMGPQARQMLQSPEFRRMLTDPQMIRQMRSMQQAFGGGMGGFGGMGGNQDAFPAPGETTTTGSANRDQPAGANPNNNNNAFDPYGMFGPNAAAAGPNPFAALFQGGANAPTNTNANTQAQETTSAGSQDTQNAQQGQQQQPPPNPFAALFNPAMMGNQQGQGQQGGMNPFDPATNPFLNNPEAFNRIMGAMRGGPGNPPAPGSATTGAAANPWANFANMFGGAGGAGFGAPPDNRPPEERYATQLRQLNEMGFFNYEQNIQALTRSGGDVNGALEFLFSQT